MRSPPPPPLASQFTLPNALSADPPPWLCPSEQPGPPAAAASWRRWWACGSAGAPVKLPGGAAEAEEAAGSGSHLTARAPGGRRAMKEGKAVAGWRKKGSSSSRRRWTGGVRQPGRRIARGGAGAAFNWGPRALGRVAGREQAPPTLFFFSRSPPPLLPPTNAPRRPPRQARRPDPGLPPRGPLCPGGGHADGADRYGPEGQGKAGESERHPIRRSTPSNPLLVLPPKPSHRGPGRLRPRLGRATARALGRSSRCPSPLIRCGRA